MYSVLIFVHVVGITIWVGGLFVYVLALMPSLTAVVPAERGKLMGAFLKRYVPLNWVALALAVVTGLILTSRVIGFPSLFSFNTRYGNTLLAKIILVLALIANGAYLGMVLGPKVASFAPPPGAGPPGPGAGGPPPGPPPELLRLQKRLATQTWVQVGLALAVLLANALL